jgi:cytochrome P450
LSIEFEPFSPAIRDNPYSHYRELRDRAPVHYAPESKVWCVSRYDDVMTVLNDPETYSSEAMFSMLMNAGAEGPPPITWNTIRFVGKMLFQARMRPIKFQTARSLIAEDGEQHSETRKIVNRGFTPRRIALLEPRVRQLADEALRDLRAGKPFDIVEDFATPLPVMMISELLGIEPERRADFKRWSDVIVGSSSTIEGRELRNQMDPQIADTMIEMLTYLRGVARARRKSPSDDLISTIVTNQEGGAGLTDYDVVSFVLVLLVAGNETTTNLIGNAVSALFDHPDQLERLAAAPELVGLLLEETLRFNPPIQLVFRTTTRDVEIRGVRIPKGQYVAPLLGSANRDERRFPDPDRFDIERRPQGHVGLGFGKHFCLGSSLARLEASCAMEALLPELPKLVLREEKREWLDSFLVRGPAQLKVERA